ncbi:hypothetical protein HDU67_010340 [Dinochytrium kinnereticum]|nr:hypothetical protein HDU67_010340 [Dinochytrium kinnereticum]
MAQVHQTTKLDPTEPHARSPPFPTEEEVHRTTTPPVVVSTTPAKKTNSSKAKQEKTQEKQPQQQQQQQQRLPPRELKKWLGTEALGSLDTLANTFLWPYSSPSMRAGSPPGESHTSLFPGSSLPAGLRDYGSYYAMTLAMPGLAENDVSVRFSESGARLRVDAHAKTVDRQTGRRGEVVEVAVVTVPRDAIVERAAAEMGNGILTLNIPKRQSQSADMYVPVQGPKPARGYGISDFFSAGSQSQPQQGHPLQSAFDKAGQEIYNTLPQSMREQSGIMDAIRSALHKAYESGGGMARSAGETMQSGTEAARQYGSAATERVKEAGGYAADQAREAAGYARDSAGYATDRAKEAGGYFGNMGSSATEGLKHAGAYVTDAGTAATDRLKNAGEYVVEQLQNMGAYATDAGSAATARVKEAGEQVYDSARHMGEAAMHMGQNVADTIKSATSVIGAGAAHTAQAATSIVAEGVKKAGEGVAAATEAVKELPHNVVCGMKEQAGSARDYVCETVFTHARAEETHRHMPRS